MDNKQKVIIFGAGIAGLSTAHYLNQHGYDVTVIEKLDIPGGLARSQRYPSGLPTEYSWRGFGPWYHNTFDIMKKIKTASGTVYDELKPISSFDLVGDNEYPVIGWYDSL